jgi:hypothetical protein
MASVADANIIIESLEYRLAEIISRCKQVANERLMVADAVNVSQGNQS